MVLSRSCQSCVIAKRRCSLETPICRRCSAHNLRCVYANELSTYRSNRAMQDTPTSWILDTRPPPSSDVDFIVLASGRDQTANDTGTDWHRFAFSFLHCAPQLVFANRIYDQPTCYPVVLTVDDESMQYILRVLRNMPSNAESMYIHQDLAQSIQRPRAAVKVESLIAGASQQLDHEDQARLTQDLERAIRELIAYTHRAKPEIDTLLVCVQALLGAEITLSIGRLSSCSIPKGFHTCRSKQLRVLSQWCWKLWEQAPWTLPKSTCVRQSWLFAESIRRTLLVSHIFCDSAAVMRTGVFKFSGFVSTLPYDSRTWLWWNKAEVPLVTAHAEAELQSFRQLVLRFESGMILEGEVDELEALMLVACRGHRVVSQQLGLPLFDR